MVSCNPVFRVLPLPLLDRATFSMILGRWAEVEHMHFKLGLHWADVVNQRNKLGLALLACVRVKAKVNCWAAVEKERNKIGLAL